MPRANPEPLSLAISLSSLSRHPSNEFGRARAQIHWAADLQFRAVITDGAARETRARALDRAARRDLAALLRRRELTSAGVDLWLPTDHLLRGDLLDRAVSALKSAIGLSAELASLTNGAPVLHTALPDEAAQEAVESIGAAAMRDGVTIAVYSYPWRNHFGIDGGFAAGFDAALFTGERADPLQAAAELSGRIGGARLSLGSDGTIQPNVDASSVAMALAAAGYTGFVSLNLQEAHRPREAALSLRNVWRSIQFPGGAPSL